MRRVFAGAAVAAAIALGGCAYDPYPGYGYYGGGGYYGSPAYSGGVVAFGTTYGGWNGDRGWHNRGWHRGGWHRDGWYRGRQWQNSGWRGRHDHDGPG